MNPRFNKDTQLFLSVSQTPGSFGMSIYNQAFAEMGLNAFYISRYLKEVVGFGQIMRNLDIRGTSVSMPFKTTIASELDEISPEAARTKSINTILNRDGRLHGYNTDYTGFSNLLASLDSPPRSVLIYGTGSVVASIVLACQEKGATVFLVGRNAERTAIRAKELGIDIVPSRLRPGEVDFVINATPANLAEIAELAGLNFKGVRVFDIKVASDFKSASSLVVSKGGIFIPGLMMFLYQFQRQFEIYTGKSIPDEDLRRLSRNLFNYDWQEPGNV